MLWGLDGVHWYDYAPVIALWKHKFGTNHRNWHLNHLHIHCLFVFLNEQVHSPDDYRDNICRQCLVKSQELPVVISKFFMLSIFLLHGLWHTWFEETGRRTPDLSTVNLRDWYWALIHFGLCTGKKNQTWHICDWPAAWSLYISKS